MIKQDLPTTQIDTIKEVSPVAFQQVTLYDGTKYILLPENWRSIQTMLMGKDRYFLVEDEK